MNGIEARRSRGVAVGGREPKALLLRDGSRLALEGDGPGGRPDWALLGDNGLSERDLSVAEAMRIAGAGNAQYVRVRTRAEAAWLRLVSEWFEAEASRLDTELEEATAART